MLKLNFKIESNLASEWIEAVSYSKTGCTDQSFMLKMAIMLKRYIKEKENYHESIYLDKILQ